MFWLRPAQKTTLGWIFLCLFCGSLESQQKPPLTLDDFFNYVAVDHVRLSPDGHSLVIATERADWEKQVFRKDLWLYRDGSPGLMQLTQSGQDHDPQWSPDGKWIAFLSDRKAVPPGADTESSDKAPDKEAAQLYLIAPSGGEALPVTRGEEEVHSYAWSPDSKTLYFATRLPWSKTQQEAYKKEWKDAEQYREAERGDAIYRITLAEAFAQHAAEGTKSSDQSEALGTPGAVQIATSQFRVQPLAAAPDGTELAFISNAISQRWEDLHAYEIYLVKLDGATQEPERLTNNNGQEEDLHWSPDSKRLFFIDRTGSADGPYQDAQWKIYSLDVATKALERWGRDFDGNINEYALTQDGGLLAAGDLATQVHLYYQPNPSTKFTRLADLDGAYEAIATSSNSGRLAFVYSTLQKPTEVYLAESAASIRQATAVSSFNHLLTERELPQGRPYTWKADDGSPVTGMLIYPPGKFGAKHLPMFTFIHGGPAEDDGDHFEADWYKWDRLAATQGWLVFQPNYRGSFGYGDRFTLGIIPKLVSRPGKDILEGIDALVHDGIADPDRLAIGGYSYGGYMTNWLITQTDRFRAAVTGAGAVEHAANWGNDDTTFDDSYFLGGRPWEATQNYTDEGAIFHFGNVKTPTHIVAGADDIRVAVSENYLLDHALHSLGIPESLLIFPGEGHGLTHNPWHGKIKVREELKWLEKYGLSTPTSSSKGDAR